MSLTLDSEPTLTRNLTLVPLNLLPLTLTVVQNLPIAKRICRVLVIMVEVRVMVRGSGRGRLMFGVVLSREIRLRSISERRLRPLLQYGGEN